MTTMIKRLGQRKVIDRDIEPKSTKETAFSRQLLHLRVGNMIFQPPSYSMEVLKIWASRAGALVICSGAQADSPLSERGTHTQLTWSHPRATSPLVTRVPNAVKVLPATCQRRGCIWGASARRPLVFPSSPCPAWILFLLRKERRQRRERPRGASVWSWFGLLTREGSPGPAPRAPE